MQIKEPDPAPPPQCFRKFCGRTDTVRLWWHVTLWPEIVRSDHYLCPEHLAAIRKRPDIRVLGTGESDPRQ